MTSLPYPSSVHRPGRAGAWRRWFVPLALAAAAGSTSAQSSQRYYEAHDLGPVASGSQPIGCIARNGAIALTMSLEVSPGEFLDRAVVLPALVLYPSPDFHTRVTGCNSRNEYVGSSGMGGVIWDKEWSSAQALPPSLSGPAEPLAISDGREVVGRKHVAFDNPLLNHYVAMVWTTGLTPNVPDVTPRELFPGEAVAINKYGLIAATHAAPSGRQAVFVDRKAGRNIVLLPPGAVTSDATGIDDENRVVGHSTDAAGRRSGFVWRYGGAIVPLWPSRLAKRVQTHTTPRAVGAGGNVVGQSYDVVFQVKTDPQATVWPQAGPARNLNDEVSVPGGNALKLTLVDAIGVADNGNVLCEGRTTSGDRRAILLKPRPGGSWR